MVGATLSAFAGWRGMVIATQANVRTTAACDPATGGSINEGLKVAFKSGAVMGLGVTGLGLLGISVMYLIYVAAGIDEKDSWQYLSGFGFGASCIALFARVGGGVYTKAADVGADLVGKVEAGIPEDHPNNAAVIADNVGDNVGDVAGMGADLFESFVGSIIASCALATSQFRSRRPRAPTIGGHGDAHVVPRLRRTCTRHRVALLDRRLRHRLLDHGHVHREAPTRRCPTSRA